MTPAPRPIGSTSGLPNPQPPVLPYGAAARPGLVVLLVGSTSGLPNSPPPPMLLHSVAARPGLVVPLDDGWTLTIARRRR